MRQQPNTLVTSGDVENCVLLIGGEHPPVVMKLVASVTESCQPVTESRGFFTYRCKTRRGTPFTLAITGVGPSATEMAFVEYHNCGAEVFIRAGTSGALSKAIARGSVVITTSALRFDGVSDLYVTRRFRAIANREIIQALEHSAQKLGIEYRSGVTLSTSAFYAMDDTAMSFDTAFGSEAQHETFEPRGLRMLQEMKERAFGRLLLVNLPLIR